MLCLEAFADPPPLRSRSVARIGQEGHKTSTLDSLGNRALTYGSTPAFTTTDNAPVSIG